MIIILFTLGVAAANETSHDKHDTTSLEKTSPNSEKIITKTETQKKH
jgi:hypothetical protein